MQIPDRLKAPLRPLREVILRMATAGRGLRRTVNGFTFSVDPRTRYSFPPSHDPGVAKLLSTRPLAGAECWNVGANVGVHVLQLAERVGPTGRVVAFEPNPHAAALLKRNIHLNGYSARVEIVEAAVGEREAQTNFYIAGADPMGRPGLPNPLLSRTHRITVPVLNLNSYLAGRQTKPNCLIIDIEGWEIAALRGAEDVLRLDPLPLLIVELHPDAWEWSGHSRQDFESLLHAYKLEVVGLSGQADSLSENGQVLLRGAETPNPSLQRTLPG